MKGEKERKGKEKCCLIKNISTAILIQRYGVYKVTLHPVVSTSRCPENSKNTASACNTSLKHYPSLTIFSPRDFESLMWFISSCNKI